MISFYDKLNLPGGLSSRIHPLSSHYPDRRGQKTMEDKRGGKEEGDKNRDE